MNTLSVRMYEAGIRHHEAGRRVLGWALMVPMLLRGVIVVLRDDSL